MSIDSKPLAAARKVAEEYCKTIRGDDPRLNGAVYLNMEDGSVFVFQDSFAMTHCDDDNNEWIFVFSEHYPTNVFAADEVNRLQEYKVLGQNYSTENNPETLYGKSLVNKKASECLELASEIIIKGQIYGINEDGYLCEPKQNNLLIDRVDKLKKELP